MKLNMLLFIISFMFIQNVDAFTYKQAKELFSETVFEKFEDEFKSLHKQVHKLMISNLKTAAAKKEVDKLYNNAWNQYDFDGTITDQFFSDDSNLLVTSRNGMLSFSLILETEAIPQVDYSLLRQFEDAYQYGCGNYVIWISLNQESGQYQIGNEMYCD